MSNDTTPIALYDADQKQLIAVFESGALATRFLYGSGGTYNQSIWKPLHNKTRIPANKHQLGCTVAVRFASASQIAELNGNPYLLKQERYALLVQTMASSLKLRKCV